MLPTTDTSFRRLRAFPAGGTAPHAVRFDVSLAAGDQVSLDLESDGTVDFEGTTLEDRSFAFLQPGVFVTSVRITSANGDASTVPAIGEVYDRAALNARLQATWGGMKDALRRGDVTEAVTFIHSRDRTVWQDYFSQATAERLSGIDGILTSIELVEAGRGRAEYRMLREQDGRVFSYTVVFIVDDDGQWRL